MQYAPLASCFLGSKKEEAFKLEPKSCRLRHLLFAVAKKAGCGKGDLAKTPGLAPGWFSAFRRRRQQKEGGRQNCGQQQKEGGEAKLREQCGKNQDWSTHDDLNASAIGWL